MQAQNKGCKWFMGKIHMYVDLPEIELQLKPTVWQVAHN